MSSDIVNQPILAEDRDALYWSNKPNEAILLTKEMAMVSALAEGLCVHRIPQSYEELESMVPEEDPITAMVTIFAMLRTNGKHARFEIFGGLLHLISDEGSITFDYDLDAEDGLVEDLSILHSYAPLYHEMPDSVEALMMMLKGNISFVEAFGLDIDMILKQPFNIWCSMLISWVQRNPSIDIETFNIILKSVARIRIQNLMTRLTLLIPPL